MGFPRTKIQIPLVRNGPWLARPALDARLGNALLNRRLVLVCAAAGFGKTSTLARQIAQLPAGTAVAWVACDDGDTPAQLFECLIAALEPYDLPWRTAPEALLRVVAEPATPAQRRDVAAQLINALDACEVPHGVVVVDDLHRVSNPLVHEFLDQMLERLPPRWTLALATRTEPPLALARLHAAGEVEELRLDGLRFDADEARALAAEAGLDASAAERVQQRAQGWPAGLRLAINALRGGAAGSASPAVASDRHAVDFLGSEVIDPLPAPLRDFLLRCSVLPELSATRCAALTGDADAGRWLHEIERAGLFVTSLEGAETTLRLHDLFRDALQARLAREQPERLPELYRRAAQTESDLPRRLAWLQRAGSAADWAAAADLLAAAGEELVSTGRAADLRDALERFPLVLREQHAGLQLAHTLCAWVRWDWDAALHATRRAAALCKAAGDVDGERHARSYEAIALAGANHPQTSASAQALIDEPGLATPVLCRAILASTWADLRGGDQRRLAPSWTRLLDMLEQTRSLPRWYECSPLPPFVGLPGMRAPLQRYIDGAMHRLPEHPTPLRGVCHTVQAWLHLWRGDVAAAEASLAAARSDGAWLARPVNVDSYTRSLDAVLLALRGRAEDAQAVARALVAEVQADSEPLRVRVYHGLYLFLWMRVSALQGDAAAIEEAARLLEQRQRGGEGWLSSYQSASAGAHLAEAAGRLDEACALWRTLLAHEHRSDIYGQVAEARLRLAELLWRRGRPVAEAAAVLLPLFEQLDASGEWGAVWMAGPALLGRLAAFDWAGSLPAPRLAELQRWAASAAALAAGAAPRSAATAAVPAGLSAREAEVLARIAAGDSNKLIARAFDLSPHTVKRHVANILDKLGLSSRGQAAAWYRAHPPG